MKKLPTVSRSILAGFFLVVLVLDPFPLAIAGDAEKCAPKNGDVNADGKVDLSDAVTILGHLFLGNPTELVPLCTPPASPSGVAATGQATCSTFVANEGLWVEVPCGDADCPGQDGKYKAGCTAEGRFVDNGDGTVTDTCTGLMWQQNTADVSGDEQINFEGDALVWCEALTYCENLNFAGHDDWRLPNARELQSIVDYGRREPAIDPVFQGLAEYYWSSTSYSEAFDDAWGVGFNVGYVGIRVKVGDFDFSFNFVRAVRNEP